MGVYYIQRFGGSGLWMCRCTSANVTCGTKNSTFHKSLDYNKYGILIMSQMSASFSFLSTSIKYFSFLFPIVTKKNYSLSTWPGTLDTRSDMDQKITYALTQCLYIVRVMGRGDKVCKYLYSIWKCQEFLKKCVFPFKCSFKNVPSWPLKKIIFICMREKRINLDTKDRSCYMLWFFALFI
jgi:hypothetical protein